MLIYFRCEHCQAKLEIEADAEGTHLPCPHCGEEITVPRKILGPGITVGDFRILRPLGKGAMGEVYLAQQLSMQREIALKIFPATLAIREDMIERFLGEVRMQAKLDHPNIVTAHAAGEDEGTYYMAMTYVRGEPLDRVIQREGPLGEVYSLRIIRSVAEALRYAWDEHRMLHRDVKPSNIILDHRGVPKLTDLGLSKSLNAGVALTQTEMLMGTPNYMSPEQASGTEQIDFRTDMYSLGMTFYHMVSGQIPYASNRVMEILRKQATEPLPDPRDFNPELSAEAVALMQIMLAKNPQRRHASWDALLADIDRVLAGTAPSKRSLAPGESALLRRKGMPRFRQGGKRPWVRALAAAGVVALIALVAAMFHRGGDVPAPATESAGKVEPDEASPDAVRREALAGEWGQLVERMQQRGDINETIEAVEQFAGKAKGTAFADEAHHRLQRLRALRREAIREAAGRIHGRALQIVAEQGAGAALVYLERYSGPWAAETAEYRAEWQEEIKVQAAEQQASREKAEAEAVAAEAERAREADANAVARNDAELESVFDAVAGHILDGELDRADVILADAMGVQVSPRVRERLEAVDDAVEHIGNMRQIILDSFEADIGRTVSIVFKDGFKRLRITGVGEESVRARRDLRGAGFAELEFAVSDLSSREILRRLGRGRSPTQYIMRGVVFYRSARPDQAYELFVRAGGPLGSALARRVEVQQVTQREASARRMYASILRMAGVSTSDSIDAQTLQALRNETMRIEDRERLAEAIARFRKLYAETETGQTAEPVLQALDQPAPSDVTIVETGMEEELAEALREANPDVVGLVPLFEDTREGLALNLSGNRELRDIGPVAGLPIVKLDLSQTGVEDLSPLKGMALRELNLWDARVTDLRPLRGMPLRVLNLAVTNREATSVTDLRPLWGMPLEWLDLHATAVDDIRALKGMPLKWLKLEYTNINDLRALRGAPLKWLALRHTQVADLEPLRGMPLEHLDLTQTQVEDLEPLAGSRVTWLSLGNTPVTDLSPLSGLPLETLLLYGTAVTDLTPLQECPLVALHVGYCSKLADLSALRTIETLRHLFWDPSSSGLLVSPVREALEAQAYDEAELAARRLLRDFDRVPAFAPMLEALRDFLEDQLPRMRLAADTIERDPRDLARQGRLYHGHRYLLIPLFVEAPRAKGLAEKFGGHVVSINSADEQQWLQEQFSLPGMGLWIGGSDHAREGVWTWYTGEKSEFKNWAGGQPDNAHGKEHYVIMQPDGMWNDVEAEFLFPFIIEWE